MKRRYALITLLAAVIVTSRPVYGTCDATWTSEILFQRSILITSKPADGIEMATYSAIERR
jgi:hypothetical protein